MIDDGGLLAASESSRPGVLNELLQRHRKRLVRMADVRLHPQVRARVDASDVVQEAYLSASRRVEEYVADPRIPFFIWLRRLVGQRLHKAHRFHLDAQRRDVRREAREDRPMPDVSVVALVDRLVGMGTTPTQRLARDELRGRLADAVAALSATDREVLSLRHFEGLTNQEVAHELGVDKHAASKRYIRALRRLRQDLGAALPWEQSDA